MSVLNELCELLRVILNVCFISHNWPLFKTHLFDWIQFLSKRSSSKTFILEVASDSDFRIWSFIISPLGLNPSATERYLLIFAHFFITKKLFPLPLIIYDGVLQIISYCHCHHVFKQIELFLADLAMFIFYSSHHDTRMHYHHHHHHHHFY